MGAGRLICNIRRPASFDHSAKPGAFWQRKARFAESSAGLHIVASEATGENWEQVLKALSKRSESICFVIQSAAKDR
jgi:hypothetical protein